MLKCMKFWINARWWNHPIRTHKSHKTNPKGNWILRCKSWTIRHVHRNRLKWTNKNWEEKGRIETSHNLILIGAGNQRMRRIKRYENVRKRKIKSHSTQIWINISRINLHASKALPFSFYSFLLYLSRDQTKCFFCEKCIQSYEWRARTFLRWFGSTFHAWMIIIIIYRCTGFAFNFPSTRLFITRTKGAPFFLAPNFSARRRCSTLQCFLKTVNSFHSSVCLCTWKIE